MHSLWMKFVTWLSHSAFVQWLQNSDILRTTPVLPWKLMWGYVGFIGICAALGLVVSFLPIHRSLKERISVFAWTNAFLGGLLFFFRYQYLPILGMDMWRLVQEVGAGIWIIFLIQYFRTGYQKQLRAEEAMRYKEKYLPKAKTPAKKK